MKNEIILYRPNELAEHINYVFSEGELLKEVVVANFALTTPHCTQFRIWANQVLKDYCLN